MILLPQYHKSWDDGSPLHEVYIHNCQKSWKFQLICKHHGSNLHGINATGVGEWAAKEKQQGKEMDRAILRTNKASFPPEAIERQKTQKLADKVKKQVSCEFLGNKIETFFTSKALEDSEEGKLWGGNNDETIPTNWHCPLTMVLVYSVKFEKKMKSFLEKRI